MLIRPFNPADEPAVIALWHACALTRPWNNPSLDIARKLKVDPKLFLVGHENGLIVASAMFGYEGHRGWVNYLAVDPSHQRKGYATQLMQHGERLLRAVGCPKLNLQVRSTNASTLAFYESLGYKNDEVISLGKRLISDE
ncbi:MAG: GNAT family acetyltransferase [Betaproteobacteria bacterium]